MEKLVYLDTHVVVWLYAGELTFFPREILRILEKEELVISPIILLELQYLLEIEKIKVGPEKIFRELETRIGLKICDREFNKVVVESLRQSWTRDPFDRLIVAQAHLAQASLITKDQFILRNYRKAVWFHP